MSAVGSSSVSSATPPPSILSKDKGKTQDHGRNEGVDLKWAFAPPPGYVLLEEDTDAGEFDWDRINDNEDLELCLIRVPDSVKPNYLENLQLHMPVSSIPPRSTVLGNLKRKHMTFDIWSVGEGDDRAVGGEELKGLSCLLPRRKKKGKLYPAPKPFAHHLLLSAQSVLPTPCAPSAGSTQTSISTGPPYKNPPRQSYPKEVLKHQFMPYGSLVNVANSSNEMDIDTHQEDDHEPSHHRPSALTYKHRKGKKEEIHSESPTDPSSATKVQFEGIHIEPAINSSTAAKEESVGKKVKGKKRKGESSNTMESSPAKKSKKAKTSG